MVLLPSSSSLLWVKFTLYIIKLHYTWIILHYIYISKDEGAFCLRKMKKTLRSKWLNDISIERNRITNSRAHIKVQILLCWLLKLFSMIIFFLFYFFIWVIHIKSVFNLSYMFMFTKITKYGYTEQQELPLQFKVLGSKFIST